MPKLSREIVRENTLKANLKERKLQVGILSSLCSNIVAEMLSYVGADWILFDMEHAPNDLPTVFSQLQAMNGSTSVPVIRPPWNDMVILKQLLDAGCHNFIIPFVQNEAEAKGAVASVRYPPEGIRGVAGSARGSNYGFEPDYWNTVNEHISIIVQVETAQAVARLDSIAGVDGVDCIFIGPNDLAASMGHLMDSGCKEVQDMMARIPQDCARHGKAAGTLAFTPDDVKRYIDMGYNFIGLGSDIGLLKKAALDILAPFR